MPVLATAALQVTADAVYTVWWSSLGMFAAVLVVVAVLLTLIVATARKIHGGVLQIWTVGQRIANNTVHVALLDQTNRVAAGILASAQGLLEASRRIKEHAESCPKCPACVLGPEWARGAGV